MRGARGRECRWDVTLALSISLSIWSDRYRLFCAWWSKLSHDILTSSFSGLYRGPTSFFSLSSCSAGRPRSLGQKVTTTLRCAGWDSPRYVV